MNKFQHPFLDDIIQTYMVSSTMARAEKMIEEGNASGNFLIIAEQQGNGVGRKGNNWYSPEGGLWFSLGIYGFSFASNFTLFCGLQILKAIETSKWSANLTCKIKWPNDIYINGKKAAGIIVKHLPRSNYYIIGVGLNTNLETFPPGLQNTATSLKLETGETVNHRQLMSRILDNLSENLPGYLANLKIDDEDYRKHDHLHNREIAVKTEFAEYRGFYHGISPAGAIQLKLSNGAIQPFYAGEILIIS